MPDRVLFLENTLGFGGSTVALARLLCRLDRGRFTPEVVVSHRSQADYLRRAGFADAPIHLVSLPTPPLRQRKAGILQRVVARAGATTSHMRYAIRYSSVVRELVRGREPALLHLNNGVAANLGGIALAARLRVPAVVKQRGYEWRSAELRLVARSVRAFMPDSEHVARDLVGFGVPRQKIVVTYCPIDLGAHDETADPRDVRRALGLPEAAPTFGIVGCLQEWKGQHVFLEAAARVIANVPEARGVIVGAAPEGADLAYPTRLRDLAARLGIADRVVFAGHRDDIPRTLLALDVCVHASLLPEPFGTVIAEAMASRRPVVASAAGGPLEIVAGESGFLTSPGDAAALASAVTRLLRDPAERGRMGEAGRKRVAALFSADRHVEVTESVYRSVLA